MLTKSTTDLNARTNTLDYPAISDAVLNDNAGESGSGSGGGGGQGAGRVYAYAHIANMHEINFMQYHPTMNFVDRPHIVE